MASIRAGPPAAENSVSEVKAAGLIKLISFVDWPADSFATAEAPLVIRVLGTGPTSACIDSSAIGEIWRGRPIVVQRFRPEEPIGDYHVLFVTAAEQENWPRIREQLSGRSILTVSDADQFAASGGMIQLTPRRNRLHLLVNVAVARQCRVTISSKILRVAHVIGDERP